MTIEAYVFAFKRPDGQWGAVTDTDQRLFVTMLEPLASAFESALHRRLGIPIAAVARNPVQVAELVMTQHVAAYDIAEYLTFLESDQCLDEEDAIWRAIDLADTVPVDTLADWNAAHERQAKP